MRILVVQTTRMGDVIQTSPLVQQIRDKHPEAHISLMVRRMGKAVAERHPAVNEVIEYDEDEMFLHLRSGDSDRLLKAYALADARIRRLRDAGFDLAYNVTNSIASAMLLKLAGIPKVIGAHLSDDWQFLLRGPWTTYFFTSVFSREYNDLNLCDIFRLFEADAPPCRRLVFKSDKDDLDFANNVFDQCGIREGDFVACMQLGASEAGKRWPEAHFARLAQLLLAQYGAKILLLGVAEEAPLGEVFAHHAPGLGIPLYGKTTIAQAVALLRRANVLITNDTGTMHLAAAADCPIVLVSVGSVHYRETGPYGEGHCALEMRRYTLGQAAPATGDAQEQIQPEHALRAVETVIAARRGEALPLWSESAEFANLDAHITRFAPDGCLRFYPLIRRMLSERDFMRIAYRAMWLDHLGDGRDARREHESIRAILDCYDMPPAETLREWRKRLGGAFRELAAIAQRGVRQTEALLEALRRGETGRAKRLVAELMALDEEARIFGEINAACRPLVLIARFERDNLEGMDPTVLARSTRDIYRACYARTRMVEEKIQVIAGMRCKDDKDKKDKKDSEDGTENCAKDN